MNDFFSIVIDRNSKTPIYLQLANAIAELVQTGTLKPDTKLPPIRKIADALNVNNVTIVNAYKHLENKKIVYSVVGSGTYISELPFTPSVVASVPVSSSFLPPVESRNDFINFANTNISADLFPVSEFKGLFNEVLERDKGNAFRYEENQGYEPLRKSLCEYLERYGIKTTYDKIQITSGAQQAIDIIAKATLNIGDTVIVERPTYYGALGAFLSRGAQIIEAPLENDGLDMAKLEALLKTYSPKFIYVMTYFQTPTCISYSTEKKRKLLELAIKYDTFIIEEDNQSDFNFSNSDVVPLKALDYKSKVIYVKSFSKISMPGLRLGFIVLPPRILSEALKTKAATDIQTSGFIQRAFDLYINSGFDRHVTSMKAIFKKRYEAAYEAAETFLKPYVKYNQPNGGLNFWFEIKNKRVTDEDLCNALLKQNVAVTPGALFSTSRSATQNFRVSIAGLDKEAIVAGIKIIGDTLGAKRLGSYAEGEKL